MLKKSSVSVAKSRLKLLIVSDRISCSPAEWNEAGSWSFDINGTIYQYENSDIA